MCAMSFFFFFPPMTSTIAFRKMAPRKTGRLDSPQPDALAQAVFITTPNCNATVSEEKPIYFSRDYKNWLQ